MHSWIHIIASFFVLPLLNGNVFAAARLEPLTVGYSNFTGTYAPLWIAVEPLEMLSLQYPQAKQTDASLIVEPSFIKKNRRERIYQGAV